MPEDRTVLDHLLEGRDALQREVQRLTAAIDQLDSVLGRIGSATRGDGSGETSGAVPDAPTVADPVAPAAEPAPVAQPPVVPAPTSPAPVAQTPVPPAPVAPAEPVNPPVEVEPPAPAPATVPSRPRAARKAPAKKTVRARRSASTEPPKSIRVHVLEMLQAENRDFGLAEIIDRVHDAGIQAHDDAVRSITIKLMKDGRVERVGRGQYRLARRGSAARAGATVAPRVAEPAPESAAPVDPEPTTYPTYAPATDDVAAPVDQAGADPVADAVEDTVAEPASDEPPATAANPSEDQPSADPSSPTSLPTYTPSLNLGQPWNS